MNAKDLHIEMEQEAAHRQLMGGQQLSLELVYKEYYTFGAIQVEVEDAEVVEPPSANHSTPQAGISEAAGPHSESDTLP